MSTTTYASFEGDNLLASGPLEDVLAAVKRAVDAGRDEAEILIFHTTSGGQRDFDLRGTLQDVLDRTRPASTSALAKPPKRGRGRPKLGVTSKEVTLLPRHWDWLASRGKSPSAELRRLVETAMRSDPRGEASRPDLEAVSRMMTALAGNLPDFEEATRALYRKDAGLLKECIATWPADVRQFVLHQATLAMDI